MELHKLHLNHKLSATCLSIHSFPIVSYLPQKFLFCRPRHILSKQTVIMPARVFDAELSFFSILFSPRCSTVSWWPSHRPLWRPMHMRLVCSLPSQHHPECHALLGTHTLSTLTCLQLALSDFPALSFQGSGSFHLSWILSGCLWTLPSAQRVHTDCVLRRRCFAYVTSFFRACVVHASWPVPLWALHLAGHPGRNQAPLSSLLSRTRRPGLYVPEDAVHSFKVFVF